MLCSLTLCSSFFCAHCCSSSFSPHLVCCFYFIAFFFSFLIQSISFFSVWITLFRSSLKGHESPRLLLSEVTIEQKHEKLVRYPDDNQQLTDSLTRLTDALPYMYCEGDVNIGAIFVCGNIFHPWKTWKEQINCCLLPAESSKITETI